MWMESGKRATMEGPPLLHRTCEAQNLRSQAWVKGSIERPKKARDLMATIVFCFGLYDWWLLKLDKSGKGSK